MLLIGEGSEEEADAKAAVAFEKSAVDVRHCANKEQQSGEEQGVLFDEKAHEFSLFCKRF